MYCVVNIYIIKFLYKELIYCTASAPKVMPTCGGGKVHIPNGYILEVGILIGCISFFLANIFILYIVFKYCI